MEIAVPNASLDFLSLIFSDSVISQRILLDWKEHYAMMIRFLGDIEFGTNSTVNYSVFFRQCSMPLTMRLFCSFKNHKRHEGEEKSGYASSCYNITRTWIKVKSCRNPTRFLYYESPSPFFHIKSSAERLIKEKE